jgi:hypothetical protein
MAIRFTWKYSEFSDDSAMILHDYSVGDDPMAVRGEGRFDPHVLDRNDSFKFAGLKRM